MLRLLIDSVEDYAIFALDPGGHILTWNRGARLLKGYAPDEIIGKHIRTFYMPADVQRKHPEHELKIAAEMGKYQEEGWRVRKDGSKFWANVTISALRDENGCLRGFGKVTRDMSERRQADLALRESEERFRLLVSNVTDYAIITLDPEGRVTSWNTGAERIKGYRPKDIIGKHISTFYPRSEAESGKAEMELRIATDEGRYEEEGWRVRKDGTMFWANVVLTPLREILADGSFGPVRGFAKVTRDLTSRRQAEEALRQSQERYRLLVDNIRDYAVILLDSQGRVTSWNTGASLITGYQTKEILGSHISRFYTEEDRAAGRPQQELRAAAELGRYEEEGRRVRKDGSIYWASVVVTPVRDDHGNLRGYSKVTTDITERKRAENLLRESEERFRLMIEGVQDYAIFMLDPNGNVSTWNRGAERNKGYAAVEIIGKHFSTFYGEEDLKSGKPAWELEEALKAGRFEDEGWRFRKDGSRFWANVVITPIYDGKGVLLGYSKVTRNLTERKRAEESLREAYADLERRIEERTKELSAAKARAEAAVAARDQFFSMASHELKTPLSSLKLQTQIRKRKIAKGDLSDFAPEKLPELCTDDERQITRLGTLVDRMLDISRISAGGVELSLEHLDLVAMAQDTVRRMVPILEQTGNVCAVTASGPVEGHWDRLRLEQILTNFLTNAGKYAPGKPVEVMVSGDGDTARFEVRDHGPGIAAEHREKIFEPFERLKAYEEISGLGLGLYITKRMIDAHHGRIRVESEQGKGTTFIVEIPRDAQDASGSKG